MTCIDSATKTGEKKVEEKVLQLGQKETFQIIWDSYKETTKVTRRQMNSFQLDGNTVDLQKTPAHYDMESEELIDAIIRRDTK